MIGAMQYILLISSGFLFILHMMGLGRIGKITGPIMFVSLLQATVFSSAIFTVFGAH